MTRRKQLWIGLAVMVMILSIAFFAGCTKRGSSKSEIWVPIEQKPMVQAPEKALTGDKETKESTLREQTLSEQTLRDQAASGKVTGSAKKEFTEKEVSILKELQIPDIHFDFDEYTLNTESQAILKAGARAYLENTTDKLVIEGHCDERGTVEYNLALGQKRADEAAKFLIDLGIAKERIKTISFGKERPLDTGHDDKAMAKNRRDHFIPIQPVK
jgi:peptidoglycan-associated lipoprotein